MPVTEPRDGIAIQYESHGDGPSLLLISGTGYTLGFWSGQLPFFAPEFRTIVFDNRGVGGSSVPPPGFSMADMANDDAHADEIDAHCQFLLEQSPVHSCTF